ncbi:MAG: ribonuclease HI family protein [Fimbriimonadales bacterium]|nr:ribonuclease HI family protein [Fimbriimonadales bacterium]
MKLFLYTDGSSIGNPGAAGAAFLLRDESGTTLAQGCESLGVATNNQAEYHALLRGLEAARAAGATVLEWFADSELLVKQWTGAYQIKDPLLRQMWQRARLLAQGMQIVAHAVPRNSSPEMQAVDRWAREAALRPSPSGAPSSNP